jgi:beta-galactosidase
MRITCLTFGDCTMPMPPTHARQTLLLDPGWRFHLGDIDSPVPNKHLAAYMNNKAGWSRGAARPNFDDSDWRVVNLPHDWAVEGKFDPANHVNQGFLPRGIAWYRRHFKLEESDRGKYLALQFDGVATHCTVYVNGHLLHRNFCGYTPFTIDISDIARLGDEDLNVIAVRVDATYMEGWWYEGAGIYRHVWLIKTGAVNLADVFVCPVKGEGDVWETRVEATVANTSDREVTCEVGSSIPSPGTPGEGEGGGSSPNVSQRLASSEHPHPCPPPEYQGRGKSALVSIAPRASAVIRQSIPIVNPELWSVDSPNLYGLRTELRINGRLVDDLVTTFGYRTLRFDPNDGFFLNDLPLKLKGTCNHQDHAGVGVALPDSIHEFRIKRLKEMGSNAYRSAHNPPAPEVLDACDRLGMLVMDENRNFGSSPQHMEQLRAMVLRDRNHPSVILWSICNEETLQGTPTGAKIARAMQAEVKRLDPSRPVTAAVSGGILNDDCIADAIEVMAINYQLATYDPYHQKHPGRPIVASETGCTLTTRGTYETDASKFVFGSYDTEKAFWGNTARETWRAVSSRPFIAGMFAWTGFDYRGEPSPHEWPCVSTHWGILDTCGFEKDAFFLHKAFFTHEPFAHVLPHWNWPGKEGTEIRVAVYTNGDEAELIVNGQSLGRKRVDPIEMAEWSVKYAPGDVKAIAYREGEAVASESISTSGPAAALGFEVHPSAERGAIPADGEFALPITVFAVDSEGHRVPAANNPVTFSISGPGSILGVGNGDPTCHEPEKGSARSLFRGLGQVIVQTTREPGQIRLKATAQGLQSAELQLTSVPTTARPSVPPATPRHFINDWRMSPVTKDRPDPNQAISDQDMNTWQRVEPGSTRSTASAVGFALFRATFTPPRKLQSQGGQIVFHEISGAATVFINGTSAASKLDQAPGALTAALAPSTAPVTVSVVMELQSPAAGLSKRVELRTY